MDSLAFGLLNDLYMALPMLGYGQHCLWAAQRSLHGFASAWLSSL
jgi:hypothetical protein